MKKELPRIDKVITVLERIAEQSRLDSDARVAMKMLRATDVTYHWCPDWDEAVICSRHNEYQNCTCDKRLFHFGITKPRKYDPK